MPTASAATTTIRKIAAIKPMPRCRLWNIAQLHSVLELQRVGAILQLQIDRDFGVARQRRTIQRERRRRDDVFTDRAAAGFARRQARDRRLRHEESIALITPQTGLIDTVRDGR